MCHGSDSRTYWYSMTVIDGPFPIVMFTFVQSDPSLAMGDHNIFKFLAVNVEKVATGNVTKTSSLIPWGWDSVKEITMLFP